jgi:hypothetical protein
MTWQTDVHQLAEDVRADPLAARVADDSAAAVLAVEPDRAAMLKELTELRFELAGARRMAWLLGAAPERETLARFHGRAMALCTRSNSNA